MPVKKRIQAPYLFGAMWPLSKKSKKLLIARINIPLHLTAVIV
jgi:hypothetical protein